MKQVWTGFPEAGGRWTRALACGVGAVLLAAASVPSVAARSGEGAVVSLSVEPTSGPAHVVTGVDRAVASAAAAPAAPRKRSAAPPVRLAYAPLDTPTVQALARATVSVDTPPTPAIPVTSSSTLLNTGAAPQPLPANEQPATPL